MVHFILKLAHTLRATRFIFMNLDPEKSFMYPPGTIHRFCAERGDVRLVEASTTEINDIVRLEDDYKRITDHPEPFKSSEK